MAQPKIDDREVKKITTALSAEGPAKAAARFDERSPEFRKAARMRQQKLRTAGQKQREMHHANTTPAGPAASAAEKPATPARTRQAPAAASVPAPQRSTPTAHRRTPGQEKVAAMKHRQAEQNARTAEEKSRSQHHTHGMGL